MSAVAALDRPALMTVGSLGDVRDRHVANAAACRRVASELPVGSTDREDWADRAHRHDTWAFRLGALLEHRAQLWGPAPAGWGVFP